MNTPDKNELIRRLLDAPPDRLAAVSAALDGATVANGADGFYTVTEAAGIASRSRPWIYAKMDVGLLPFQQDAHSNRRIPKAMFHVFLNSANSRPDAAAQRRNRKAALASAAQRRAS